jgi:DNA invertase Pin-like site-specific DNA recombinase
MDDTTPAVAYSYIRFSHPSQAEGDSLRRQTEAAADWCEGNGVTLDTSVTLKDLGRSAFTGKHRTNPDRNALAAFLRMLQEGRIPRGSYLLIENLDRLTREDNIPACHLLTGILVAGVRVVQLFPQPFLLTDKSTPFELMMAIMEMSRGHGESAMKSKRVGEAWEQKKAAARQERTPQTTSCPAWLEVVGRVREGKHVTGGSFRLIPERAAVVKRIFDLTVAGCGLALTVKKLTAEAEPFGRAGWSKAYIHRVLTGREVLGEYRPRTRRKQDGDSVSAYYPAVPGVDEGLWAQAQEALAQRKNRPGRTSERTVSVFSGLLWDARTQGPMVLRWQSSSWSVEDGKRKRFRTVTPAAALEGRCPAVSFPYGVLEEALLSRFREINPADVTGEAPDSEGDALAARVANNERVIAGILEALGDGDSKALSRKVMELEAQTEDLRKQLAAARRREANPAGAAWAEARTLLDVVKDEASALRLRALLRTTLKVVRVLVVRVRSHRLAAVQAEFVAGGHRDYLIHYRPAGNGRVGRWSVGTLDPDKSAGHPLDLRQPAHVQAVERQLLAREWRAS